MQRRWIYVLYVVLACAVIYWGSGLFASDERRVIQRLEEFAQLLQKESAESDLVAANTGRQAGLFFSRDFEINLTPFGQQITDRARLAQVVLGYRRQATRIEVGFRDIEVTIHDAGVRSAEMTCVGSVVGQVDSQPRREAYRFFFRWVEEDGIWRIEQAELIEVLEGLAGAF